MNVYVCSYVFIQITDFVKCLTVGGIQIHFMHIFLFIITKIYY